MQHLKLFPNPRAEPEAHATPTECTTANMIPNSLAKSCQEFRPDGFPEGLVAPEFQIYTAPSLPSIHVLGDVSAHDVPFAVSLEVVWIYVVRR